MVHGEGGAGAVHPSCLSRGGDGAIQLLRDGRSRRVHTEEPMPLIFDNIEEKLLPALAENLAEINRCDMRWQFLSRKNESPSTMAA